MIVLTNREITERLRQLDGWRYEDGEIRKTYKTLSFRAAIAFVVQIAMLAETADHHPDIAIRYDTVTISLMTHSLGGLTDKDIQLASNMERAFREGR